MKSFAAIALLAGAASAQYYSNGTNIAYTTITTDVYTTFCPSATTVVQNGVTYTATASQTLTITACPCTVKQPIFTAATTLSPVANATQALTTQTVSAYVTVCPTATTFTQGSQTYTGTAGQSVTVTNCPCTVTYAASSTVRTSTVSSSVITVSVPTTIAVGTSSRVVSSGIVTVPVVTTYTTAAGVSSAGTVTLGASSTTSATRAASTAATFTGAATVQKAGGALMAVGIAAALL